MLLIGLTEKYICENSSAYCVCILNEKLHQIFEIHIIKINDKETKFSVDRSDKNANFCVATSTFRCVIFCINKATSAN